MRRWTGHVGLVATILLFASYFAIPTNASTRLLIFFPVTVAVMGYLQARLHFCAQFGLIGLFNISDTFGTRESVDQREYRRKDQKKALLIIMLSIVIGLAVAAAAYLSI